MDKIHDIENNIDLGILITKYLQNGKEILLKAMIENKNKKFNLYGNELTINKDDIVVFNGTEYNLIICEQKKLKIKII